MASEAGETLPHGVGAALQRAGDWLLDQQSPTDGGWAERRGEPQSALNTAEVLLALLRVRDLVPLAEQPIRRAVDFLVGCQFDAGAWGRTVDGQPVPDVLRTAVVVEALVEAAPAMRVPAVDRAVAWLVSVRNEDGAWGYRPGAESEVAPTALVLSALLAVYPRSQETLEEPIRRGLEQLVAQQDASGSFPGRVRLEAVQTALAALCLQRAARCELSTYDRRLRRAVAWLTAHSLEAIQEVETTVEIDPDRTRRAADYSFVFMTEALVLRVLSESDERRLQTGPLARTAMQTLWSGVDTSGAVLGRRAFSWSTARALYALAAVRTHFEEFPEPTGRPPLSSHLAVLFAVLVLIAVVVLAALHTFALLEASVFVFLMLVTLLAYGRISEVTFRDLTRGITGLWGRGR